MTQWGLDTLFNPAKRHMDEEKLRQQSTRAEVGDNSGGRRIDLESGKVTIARADDELAEGESESAGAAAAAKPAKAAKAAKPAKAPSAAAVRAAKRRGREPRTS